MEHRILKFAQLAAIAIIAVSCYEVLSPFISAILFAVVVCSASWPLFRRLRKALWGKSTLAALVMVLLLLILVIGPLALLAGKLVGNMTSVFEWTLTFKGQNLIELPAWILNLPLIGGRINLYWQGLSSGGEEATALLKQLIDPARSLLLGAASAISEGLVQMGFAAFILFFLYRDGDVLIQRVHNGLSKLAGPLGEGILITINNTVSGIVNGLFGTALAQAIVAMVGFFIAGVPGVFLLGMGTFFLSPIPVGPPILWGGATIWLFNQGEYGWAVFMALWGTFGISSIDNVVRPYLISRGSGLSLVVTALGVFGGTISFGFIGIFIGPPILAVGLTLLRLWTANPRSATDAPI